VIRVEEIPQARYQPGAASSSAARDPSPQRGPHRTKHRQQLKRGAAPPPEAAPRRALHGGPEAPSARRPEAAAFRSGPGLQRGDAPDVDGRSSDPVTAFTEEIAKRKQIWQVFLVPWTRSLRGR